MAVRRISGAAVALLALTGRADAQTVSGGPETRRPPIIRPAEAAIIAGSFAAALGFDGLIRRAAQADRTQGRDDLARFGNAFGNLVYTGPLILAGWAVGEVSHNPAVARAAWRAGEATLVAGTLTAVLKLAVGRARPNAGTGPGRFRPFGGDASFPSGHTTVAVALATSLAHSTPDRWTDVAFYGAAALTGFARVNDDKHWLSDVVAGAAIGYLTGRQFHGRAGRLRPFASLGLVGVSAAF